MQIRIFAFVLVICFAGTYAWRGHTCQRLRWRCNWRSYCSRWCGWWGCVSRRWYCASDYYYQTYCCNGWTHDGDQNCNIPVCRPGCANGGTCIAPNTCKCPTYATGQFCTTQTCSWKNPCYPGVCYNINNCTCHTGFTSDYRRDGSKDGCLKISSPDEMPTIGRSTTSLGYIRRSDNEQMVMVTMDGSDNGTDLFWVNYRRFNYIEYNFEAAYQEPDDLPPRPNYVHDAKLGIVQSQIHVNVSKIPRDGGRIRDPGSIQTHQCENVGSPSNPNSALANCSITDDSFKTLLEHGDWMTIKFSTNNGGFRTLLNLDNYGSKINNHFNGQTDEKQVEFRFDFLAPIHCSDPKSEQTCPQDAAVLQIENEFTKEPIRPRWSGWIDKLSRIASYNLEIFLLSPDPYGRLVEKTPLSPVFSKKINHTDRGFRIPDHTPSEPGLYSVLLDIRDAANNSRVARRLVLHDSQSSVTLSDEYRLYVSTAVGDTEYHWQTASKGSKTVVSIKWDNHFVNKVHEDGKLLNTVLSYPIQFADIGDDNILSAKKFVADDFDDNEGKRTKDSITNFHGIVKFELAKIFTDDTEEPKTGWIDIHPLAENYTFSNRLGDGSKVRVWVRATDVLDNTLTDSTIVYFDTSPPKVSQADSPRTKLTTNVQDGIYNYSSRINFDAKDDQSGVYKLDFKIIIKHPNKADTVNYANSTSANVLKGEGVLDNPLCSIIDKQCFLVEQTLDVDNCWFLVAKDELDRSSAIVNITVFNQAWLSESILVKVPRINTLQGLEKYTGPTNIRVLSNLANGVRLGWDLPEKESCYGRADIYIVLVKKAPDGSYTTEEFFPQSTSTFYDILGLEPDKDYTVSLGMSLQNKKIGETDFAFKTEAAEAGVDPGALVGAIIAVLAVCGILFAVFVVLVRKGHFQPVQRQMNKMSVRYRKTFRKVPQRNAEDEELDIYGDMHFDDTPSWYVARNDVTFTTLIKSGHFANIYKATMHFGGSGKKTVVAKTLKEVFTERDAHLMKAKMNFWATKVGTHPNILTFVGAVADDATMGPFILYEYCENGPLNVYLKAQTSITLALQDSLINFSMSILRGMAYLASKQIVHRRLAARNVLLTFTNEVKIYGFGPVSLDEAGGDAEAGKQERVPVKWMAPECMVTTANANELSDVWSYGIVLWEIFSLGRPPFENIRSQDLRARVKKGEKPDKPEQCDDSWYAIMKRCWRVTPNKRPTFQQLLTELEQQFGSPTGGEDYYFQPAGK